VQEIFDDSVQSNDFDSATLNDSERTLRRPASSFFEQCSPEVAKSGKSKRLTTLAGVSQNPQLVHI
jgi:hypothetical protein